MGKSATSTEVPARPPANREVRKGVWRSEVGLLSLLFSSDEDGDEEDDDDGMVFWF